MNETTIDKADESIIIEISKSAALVLDALLARWDKEDMPSALRLEHPAEWAALWALEVGLETQLVELLSPDYFEHVEHARQVAGVNVGDWAFDRLTVDRRVGILTRLKRKIARSRSHS